MAGKKTSEQELDEAVGTLKRLFEEDQQDQPGQFQFLDKFNDLMEFLQGEGKPKEEEKQSQADILFQPPVA